MSTEIQATTDNSVSNMPSDWPPKDATVVCYNVSKAFGPLVAVSDLTVAIRPGVTGLLGPNGAGKSTLMRLICGLIKPNVGQVWVAGGNPRTDQQVRGRIGIVPQQDGVFERSTAKEIVELSAALNNIPNVAEAAQQALDAVELDSNMSRPLGAYSKGMRQRAKIAQAIVYNPDVIVLDEPLNGLDPKQRKNMIRLFKELGDQGRTVIVSSHILEEVEKFGSHIVVMSKGRLAAEGNFNDIRAIMDGKGSGNVPAQPRQIRITCDNAPMVAGSLIGSEAVQSCEVISPEQIKISTINLDTFRLEIAKICKSHDSQLREITPLDEDLESVFKYIVGGN